MNSVTVGHNYLPRFDMLGHIAPNADHGPADRDSEVRQLPGGEPELCPGKISLWVPCEPHGSPCLFSRIVALRQSNPFPMTSVMSSAITSRLRLLPSAHTLPWDRTKATARYHAPCRCARPDYAAANASAEGGGVLVPVNARDRFASDGSDLFRPSTQLKTFRQALSIQTAPIVAPRLRKPPPSRGVRF